MIINDLRRRGGGVRKSLRCNDLRRLLFLLDKKNGGRGGTRTQASTILCTALCSALICYFRACTASTLCCASGAERDPSRPVQYERALVSPLYAEFNKDTYWGQVDFNTDLLAPMYPHPEELEVYALKNASLPLVMSEYAHAMGNSLGGFAALAGYERATTSS